MPAVFCTVEGSSEEDARRAGAAELGVPPEDVEAAGLTGGRYRVEVVRAPFVVDVETAKDDMEGLVALIKPALGDYPQPSRDDVVEALAAGGITHGILPEEVDKLVDFVADKGVEQKNVVVARGEGPARGDDAQVTRCYERFADDGSVRCWVVVRDGQLLIERVPATAGQPGITVTGETLPAQVGEDPPVSVGSGIESDDQELSWRASVPVLGYLEPGVEGAPRVVPAVAISDDRLAVYADLRSDSGDEEPIARAEFDAAIAAAGVVHGLQPRRVEATWNGFQERGSLRRPIRIAFGIPLEAGRDAHFDFLVPFGISPGALDEESGRIDYRERGMVSNVRKGQRIGTWLPARPGADGRGVDGSALAASHGAEADLVPGENVETGEPEDGRIPIFAGIEGLVVVPAPNEVDVVDLLELSKDVDYATGNIDVKGCVLVKGTVRSGFRVTAKYAIAVDDSIEAAVVEAGSTLTVGKGIIGGGRGRVSAKKHVSTGYAQNARIRCGGDVELHRSATNSVIECGGRLIVTEGPGRLRGGRYTATAGVAVRELGSETRVPTTVAVGMNPAVAGRLRKVARELAQVRQKSRKLQRGLGRASAKRGGAGVTREQALGVRKLMKGRRDLTRSESTLRARMALLEKRLFLAEPPFVDVLGRAHPGVDIHICGASLHTEDSMDGVRYQYDPGKRRIEVQPL